MVGITPLASVVSTSEPGIIKISSLNRNPPSAISTISPAFTNSSMSFRTTGEAQSTIPTI